MRGLDTLECTTLPAAAVAGPVVPRGRQQAADARQQCYRTTNDGPKKKIGRVEVELVVKGVLYCGCKTGRDNLGLVWFNPGA